MIRTDGPHSLLCDLDQLSYIGITGSDARDFLQNQLTNDIDLLDKDINGLFGYCNPKGRLIALCRLMRHGDGFLMQLPRSLDETMVARLQKYVLRAKVSFTPLNADYSSIGVLMELGNPVLDRLLGSVPKKDHQIVEVDQIRVIRHPGLAPVEGSEGNEAMVRYQIIGPRADISRLRELLSEAFPEAAPDRWTLVDIANGIPCVEATTTEEFVPQMLNLDLVDGVSFKKGCYPGQEIVARMHYLGNLKQRMYRFQIESSAPVRVGDPVLNETAQTVGTVVASAQDWIGQWELLAVVRLSACDGFLGLENPQRTPLKPKQVSYEVSSGGRQAGGGTGD